MNGITTEKTNGHVEKGYLKHQIPNPTVVWQSLQKVIPLQDRNIRFWWHHTGYHVACMVDASGYSIEKQYEVLLFHLHFIVSSHRNLLFMSEWSLTIWSVSSTRTGSRERWKVEMAFPDGARRFPSGILLEVEYIHRKARYTILMGALQPRFGQNH